MRGFSRIIGLLLLASAFVVVGQPLRALEPLGTYIGLGVVLNPLKKPAELSCPAASKDRPCCKDHVYIFAINGLDPLCKGNFNGLCKYFKEQGFQHTYFGQLYTSHWIAGKIRQVRQEDPQARIVLIGFSLGCNYSKCIANMLCKDGISIDLLVYLSGDYIPNTPKSNPSNVCQLLNITAHGLWATGWDLFFNGSDINGAYNCRLDRRHISVPSQRETMQMIGDRLMVLACSSTPPALIPRSPRTKTRSSSPHPLLSRTRWATPFPIVLCQPLSCRGAS